MQIGMGEPNDLNRSARGIPWTPEAKQRFDIEGAQRSAKSLAVVTAVCAVLFILWGLGDWEFFPEYAWLFMYYRIGAGVLCTVLAVLAVKLTDPNLKFAAMWLWFIVWGVANAAMIPATPQYVLSSPKALPCSSSESWPYFNPATSDSTFSQRTPTWRQASSSTSPFRRSSTTAPLIST
jgi:hypothetical protein